MKKHIAAALLALGALSLSNFALADGKGIDGSLTKIDGEFYVVKDMAGKEVRGHFNASTKKVGDIKVGAMVEIYIDDSGHTTEIKEKKPK